MTLICYELNYGLNKSPDARKSTGAVYVTKITALIQRHDGSSFTI